MKKTYKIDVDCANCANKMELAARKTAGVKSATVNFMTLKMNVEFEEGSEPGAVMQEVRKNCKNAGEDNYLRRHDDRTYICSCYRACKIRALPDPLSDHRL